MRDTALWTWHIIAGLIVLGLLGLHMVIMHLNGVFPVPAFNPAADQASIDWANVAYRARQFFFMVSYIILLGAALFHGLYGLRNILVELNPPAGIRSAISGLLVVLGLALFALGAWAAVAARTVAMGG